MQMVRVNPVRRLRVLSRIQVALVYPLLLASVKAIVFAEGLSDPNVSASGTWQFLIQTPVLACQIR